GPVDVVAAPIDAGPSIDLVLASRFDNTVAWFESVGGPPPAFVEHVISESVGSVFGVHLADLNGDSFVDVVATAPDDDELIWFQNFGGNFAPAVVIDTPPNPRGAATGDLDLDGLLDVIAVAQGDQTLAWYESPAYVRHVIDDAFSGGVHVAVADVDGDSILDVIATSDSPGEVAWYRNLLGQCQLPDQLGHGNGGIVSVASDLATETAAAGNFRPNITGSISEVTFWGVYVDAVTGADCPPPAVDQFTFAYHADDAGGGGPGSLVASVTPLSVTRVVTGNVVPSSGGPLTEYEYTLTHDPLPFVADTCYWLKIQSDTTGGTCHWEWSAAAPGDARSAQDTVDGTVTRDFDLAFCPDLPLAPNGCPGAAPPNDDCGGAIAISNGDTFFSTIGATDGAPPLPPECDEGAGPGFVQEIWFTYTATCDGLLSVSTCDQATFDTRLAVYSGASPPPPSPGGPCADPQLLGCNDDAPDCAIFTSELTIDVLTGETYLIAVGGFDGQRPQGTGILTVSCGPPIGACCHPGGCLDGLLEPNCLAIGGAVWSGIGTLCADGCVGACCLPCDQICIEVTGTECAAQGGVHQGDLVTCSGVACPPDASHPTIECPGPLAVACSADVPPPATSLAQFESIGGSADDDCGMVSIAHVSDQSDGFTCPETIARTYRATDAAGNEAECMQVITIHDVTPPLVDCPALQAECIEDIPPPAQTLQEFIDLGGEVFDDCEAVTIVHLDDEVVATGCPTLIARHYEFADACGNVTPCQQDIEIFDLTPPMIECPVDVLVTGTSQVPPPDPGSLVASDNCETLEVVHVEDVTPGPPCPYTITRTYRAIDGCANFTECTQTIMVECAVGACCAPDGTCDDLIEPDCEATGGSYQGEGTDCASFNCGAACCLADGTCQQISQPACTTAGGTYQGEGTLCADTPCVGACCFGNGVCADLTLATCQVAAGTYVGFPSDCATTSCLGACCHPGGCLESLSEQDCANIADSTWNGPDSTCGSPPCPGACCLPSGACTILSFAECAAAAGVHQGGFTECTDSSCPAACCVDDGSCVTASPTECGAAGGEYFGFDVECTSVDCTGACCHPGGCIDGLSRQDCLAIGGAAFVGFGSACVAGDCNANGQSDQCDIAHGSSTDANGDQVPDECEGDGSSTTIEGVDDGETTIVVPGGGAIDPVSEPVVELTNVSGQDGASLTATEVPGDQHPGVGGFDALGNTVIIDTSIANGGFFMAISIPFTDADLAGEDPLAVDLVYYEPMTGIYELAVAGNTVPSPGHPGPIGDRSVDESTVVPTTSEELGDHGVHWNPVTLQGFAWANVDHATDFALGIAACPGDLDGSGDVGFSDVLVIIGAWGPCPPDCPEDLSGNGTVDFADILAVIAAWGACP
ncbi:MAG: FG-GAP repeat domain-containing protein, partial [Planctomycetota bacterium]